MSRFDEIAARHAARREHRRRTVQCHQAVAQAIAEGVLTRPAHCEQCGKPCKPHGHHADYAQPLAVEWLCPSCHTQRHRKPPKVRHPRGHPGFGNPLNLKRGSKHPSKSEAPADGQPRENAATTVSP